MQPLERDTLQQIGGGQSLVDWLRDALTGGTDQRDRWIEPQIDYNAQY